MGEYFQILFAALTAYYAILLLWLTRKEEMRRDDEFSWLRKYPRYVIYIGVLVGASVLILAFLGHITFSGSGSNPPGWCTYYC
jgi:multisubunit Na+/H+ antiporter MnhB subunit